MWHFKRGGLWEERDDLLKADEDWEAGLSKLGFTASPTITYGEHGFGGIRVEVHPLSGTESDTGYGYIVTVGDDERNEMVGLRGLPDLVDFLRLMEPLTRKGHAAYVPAAPGWHAGGKSVAFWAVFPNGSAEAYTVSDGKAIKLESAHGTLTYEREQ